MCYHSRVIDMEVNREQKNRNYCNNFFKRIY